MTLNIREYIYKKIQIFNMLWMLFHVAFKPVFH